MSNTDLKFTDQDGNEIDVPLDGSLGLLSTGYKGLMAMRAKREQEGYDLVGIKKKEWEDMVKANEEKKAAFEEKKKEFLDKKKAEKESGKDKGDK